MSSASLRGFDELTDPVALEAEQRLVAGLTPPSWVPGAGPLLAAGVFVAFERGQQGPGHPGDQAYVGAAATRDVVEAARVVVRGTAGASYRPGLLAAREGVMLVAAAEALLARGVSADVLLVDATGRDHPRGAGLALHLGAVLDLPSVGVTHRPLLAVGDPPADRAGITSALLLDGELVGCWLRTRAGVRPVAVHAGWRTDADTAVDVVRRVTGSARTPEPLRLARCAAREARSAAQR